MGLKLILQKKTKQNVVKAMVAMVLVSIVVNQMLWLLSMYNMHHKEFDTYINQSAQEAAWMEFSERLEIFGGIKFFSGHNHKDTDRYITKDAVTTDSTYTFTIDTHDVHSTNRILQFIIKDILPININRLDSIFNQYTSHKYVLKDTYFEYIDLESGSVLNSNRRSENIGVKYSQTDTITLDINNTIGIVGYVSISPNEILVKMLWQVILSAVLIVIAIIGIIYISKSFIGQWKTEKMRQASIYAMTHEFKRPISGAMAMVSLIPFYMERNDVKKVLTYAENIENELTKLNHYTNTIKLISNSDKSKINISKTDVEILSFFDSLKQRFEIYENEEQKVEVELNISLNTHKEIMHVDLLHFSNVIDNLIENAIKYNTNPTAIVDIIISDFDDALKIVVEDNGIGISEAHQKLIFDRYYRVKRNKSKNNIGFGLGLTYVKSIIESHGGNIMVDSKLGKGSKFIIIV